MNQPTTTERPRTNKSGQMIILVLAIVLGVLHQDFWFWDDNTLVFGFMPIGLAYHAGYSIAAACLWFLAIKIAWPYDLVAMADDDPPAVNEPTEGFTAEEAAETDGVGEL